MSTNIVQDFELCMFGQFKARNQIPSSFQQQSGHQRMNAWYQFKRNQANGLRRSGTCKSDSGFRNSRRQCYGCFMTGHILSECWNTKYGLGTFDYYTVSSAPLRVSTQFSIFGIICINCNSFSCACFHNNFTVDSYDNEISDNHKIHEDISDNPQFANRAPSIHTNNVRQDRIHQRFTNVRSSTTNECTHNNAYLKDCRNLKFMACTHFEKLLVGMNFLINLGK